MEVKPQLPHGIYPMRNVSPNQMFGKWRGPVVEPV